MPNDNFSISAPPNGLLDALHNSGTRIIFESDDRHGGRINGIMDGRIHRIETRMEHPIEGITIVFHMNVSQMQTTHHPCSISSGSFELVLSEEQSNRLRHLSDENISNTFIQNNVGTYRSHSDQENMQNRPRSIGSNGNVPTPEEVQESYIRLQNFLLNGGTVDQIATGENNAPDPCPYFPRDYIQGLNQEDRNLVRRDLLAGHPQLQDPEEVDMPGDTDTTYHEDLQIDPGRLDHEWVEQPQKHMKWATDHADAVYSVDRAADRKKIVEAQLDAKVRSDWETMDEFDKKPTEAQIQAWIIRQPEWDEASREYAEARRDANILFSAKQSMEQRARALENLTRLHLASYYGEHGGQIQQEAMTQARKQQSKESLQHSAGGKRLRRKRSK